MLWQWNGLTSLNNIFPIYSLILFRISQYNFVLYSVEYCLLLFQLANIENHVSTVILPSALIEQCSSTNLASAIHFLQSANLSKTRFTFFPYFSPFQKWKSLHTVLIIILHEGLKVQSFHHTSMHAPRYSSNSFRFINFFLPT